MPEEKHKNPQSELSREVILKAFEEMSDELGRRGASGELCLLGGTVMVLAFAARASTKDVDAIFQPSQIIREVARKVGEANGFPENWLNDAAKGFVSARHETMQGALPQFANLRITMPVPEYLLAMKCMASRIGAVERESHDVGDIVFLIRHLKLKTAKDAIDIVAAYYPKDQIPVKAQYLIEGFFEEGRI
jgi:predicted nucleotidyltransferase